MKYLIGIKLLLSMLLVQLTAISQNDENKEVRILSPFSEIKVYGTIECELIKSKEEYVELYLENVESDQIATELAGGELKIRMKIDFYDFDDIKVRAVVYYKKLDEISCGAGANLYSNDTFTGENFEISANTGGEAELKIDFNYAEISAEQGAKVYLHGKASYLDTEVNTGGSVYAFNLKSEAAKVRIDAGGTAEIWVTDDLDAEVNLGGVIRYKGNPEDVRQNTTLGGNIYSVE